MSLTVLVNDKDASVTIIQWFLSQREALNFACGPALTLTEAEFRERGHGLILGHLVEYRRRRLDAEHVVPVLETRKEKRKLRDAQAIRIEEYPPGTLVLMPLEIERCSLSGLKALPVETEQRIPVAAPSRQFWSAFDKAFAHTKCTV